MVMSAINQVLRFIVELNFGEVPMHSWKLWAQETIDETQAKRDLSMSQAATLFTRNIAKRLNFDDIIYMSYSIDFRRKVIFTMEEEGLKYPRNSEAISDWLCICIALD